MRNLLTGCAIGFGLCAGLNTYFLFVLYEKPAEKFFEVAYEVCPEVDINAARLTVEDIEGMI